MRRPRLTITLKENLIKLLDTIVDGKIIRNRSNAIENILEKYFASGIHTAVILTSGMSKFASKTPLSLLKVKDKAVIEYNIELLENAGIPKIIICSDKTDILKKYLSDKNIHSKIEYVKQKENLGGTAKALKIIKNKIKNENFILIYGDVLVNINLLDFANFHNTANAICSVALTSVINPSNWGMIKMKGTQITEFKEKPQKTQALSHVVNSGVFIMNDKIFNYMTNPNDNNLERDILPKLTKDHKLKGYMFDGQWFDTGDKEMYEKAKKQWI